MKNNFRFLLALGLLSVVCLFANRVQAQTPVDTNTTTTITGTSTNAVLANNIPNFFSQTAAWATSFDTNKSWAGVTLQFEDGLNQTTGQGAADYVRGQYDIHNWNLTIEGDFFGVGSTFNAVEGGGGYALISKYDFKAEVNALLGGTKDGSTHWRIKAEPEIKITKLMTRNTYASASISIPWVDGHSFDGTPAFRAAMGFTF